MNAAQAGVRAIVIPGVSPDQWESAKAFASDVGALCACPVLYRALGVHPWRLNALDPAIASAELELALRDRPSDLVALGECGLDFGPRCRAVARDRQRDVFIAHLELARACQLPVIVHCVGAYGPLADLLCRPDTPRCILHSYSGSAEMVARFCAHGHYIAFSGAITRPQADRARAAVNATPLDRLLLETDCPDQTPFTRRPALNEPAFIGDIARTIAEVRHTSIEAIAAATFENARRAFGLVDAVL